MLDYLKELFLKFKRIFGVFFVHFVVVQFSMSDSLSVELPLRDSLFILPHFHPFVKGFLKLFSKFFCGDRGSLSRSLGLTPALPGQLRYSITFSSSCQPFFRNFLIFFLRPFTFFPRLPAPHREISPLSLVFSPQFSLTFLHFPPFYIIIYLIFVFHGSSTCSKKDLTTRSI